MTSETEAGISLKPDIDDLVPPEASQHCIGNSAVGHPAIGDPPNVASFPKVLRRRLDNFFSEGNISPKADRAMWVKIALGLGSAGGQLDCSLRAQSGFVEVCRPLPFERPRPDIPFAEHRARQQPQRHLAAAVCKQSPELCFRCLWNQLIHVAHPPSSGPPLLHQSPR